MANDVDYYFECILVYNNSLQERSPIQFQKQTKLMSVHEHLTGTAYDTLL